MVKYEVHIESYLYINLYQNCKISSINDFSKYFQNILIHFTSFFYVNVNENVSRKSEVII